ncbi:MAG: hypothetical protein Tsb0034_12630 [Ekhidna sp.]
MKNLLSCTLILAFLFSASGQESDLDALKQTYADWVEAWNAKDAKRVAAISWGNFGFGRDAPFPRSGATDSLAYERGIGGYMDSMERIDYQVYYTNYRIVDGIGLIDGFYAQTTKPKDGPLRTVYGRQSLVLSKRNGRWKMIHYHRSALPNEFIR